MPELLAIDLDGTLVRRDGSVDPRDRDAVQGALAAGIRVALVTGRLAAGTLPVAAMLDLPGLHACADGAVLVEHPSGEVREQAVLPDAERALLRGLLREIGGPSFLLTAVAVLYDQTGESFLPYMSSWSPDLRPLDSVLDDPIWDGVGPTNTVTVGPRAELDHAIAVIQAETSLSLLTFDASAHPGTGVLVVRPPASNKGTGIARLAELHGCTVDDVVAVGDWLNDVPMFRVAGRSFAVPGCPDALAAVATDRLVAAGGQGAVAEAIGRVWG
jgi:HAD superfamily hydrolase (TIGR01484 family)